MSKMKSWNDEPAIQQKEYSQGKYNKKKRKSLRVAKLSCYSGELTAVFGWNAMLSLILFLVLLIGTAALPFIMDINIDFGPETFWCRGGIFVNLCLVFLVLFTIAAFTYAITFKITEVMCIYLDGGLDENTIITGKEKQCIHLGTASISFYLHIVLSNYICYNACRQREAMYPFGHGAKTPERQLRGFLFLLLAWEGLTP